MQKNNKRANKKVKKKKQRLLPKPRKMITQRSVSVTNNKPKKKKIETKKRNKTSVKPKEPIVKKKPVKTEHKKGRNTPIKQQNNTSFFGFVLMAIIALVFTILGGLAVKIYESKQSIVDPVENNVEASTQEASLLGNVLGNETIFIPPYVTPPPSVTAIAYQIITSDSEGKLNKKMYSKNPDMPLQPASLTKIMTAIVAMKNYPLSTEITVPPKCTTIDGSKAGFKPNDILTLQDMLYGLLVDSGADAACAIANIDGEPTFVAKMNNEAEKLGLENTHFQNEIGFDADDEQISSVNDITKITKEALKYGVFRKIVGTPYISITSKKGIKYKIYNTNDLLSKIPGTIGIKTGYTEHAKGCLSYLYEDPQTSEQILIILLGSDNQNTRFEDTQKLLEWAKKQMKLLEDDKDNVDLKESSSSTDSHN